MRNLAAIISDAANGTMPTHEECYYGMLVLNQLLDDARQHLQLAAGGPVPFSGFSYYQEKPYELYLLALAKEPCTFLLEEGQFMNGIQKLVSCTTTTNPPAPENET